MCENNCSQDVEPYPISLYIKSVHFVLFFEWVTLKHQGSGHIGTQNIWIHECVLR